MKDDLIKLYTRDLLKLREEIKLYPTEEDLWIVQNQIQNCAGNLCLHLIGNLHHFIGHGLGGSDYVRDRRFEFEGKDVPREELVRQVEATISMIEKSLDTLTDETLETEYPIAVFGEPMTVRFFMIHLHGHLNYHLGQINYHRRLITTPL